MGSRSNPQNPPPAGPPQDPPQDPPQQKDSPQDPPQNNSDWRALAPDDSPLRTMVVLKPFWESTSCPEGRMVFPARRELDRRGKQKSLPADTISLDLRIAGHRADYERWIHRGQCHDAAVAPPAAAPAAEGEEL